MKNQAGLHRWERLVELSHDLHAVTDSRGRLTFLNPAWQRLLQFSQDELLGRSFLDIVYPEDRDLATYKINERRTGNRATSDLELRMCLYHESANIDDQSRYFSVSAEGIYASLWQVQTGELVH